MRRLIGQRTWRLLHYLGFLVYILITVHGILSGTDSKHPAMHCLYLITGACILCLLYYRILIERRQISPPPIGCKGHFGRVKRRVLAFDSERGGGYTVFRELIENG